MNKNYNPHHFIHQQKITNKNHQKQEKRRQQEEIERQAAEKRRNEAFEKLTKGNVCTREEVEIMQRKHQMFRSQGHYVPIMETDANGHNVSSKELSDIYYVPIPTMMAEIKNLKRKRSFVESIPKKSDFEPLEQKYFQAIILKECFREIRSAVRRYYENISVAIHKLILGKYSFERYLNYQQRMSVVNVGRKCFDADDIDVSVVPVPEFPYLFTPYDLFGPRNMDFLSAVESYKTPFDYYLRLIRWCRYCARYDGNPEILKAAIRELMGNEGIYKEEFSTPWKMFKFIENETKKYWYCVEGFGGEEEYMEALNDYIAANGRYLIMQKVTRMINHWKLPESIKNKTHEALKDLSRVSYRQIREMYLDPRELVWWLNTFIPKDYESKNVDNVISRHGFYYY